MGHSSPATSLVDDTVRRYASATLHPDVNSGSGSIAFFLVANREHRFRRMKANEVLQIPRDLCHF